MFLIKTFNSLKRFFYPIKKFQSILLETFHMHNFSYKYFYVGKRNKNSLAAAAVVGK